MAAGLEKRGWRGAESPAKAGPGPRPPLTTLLGSLEALGEGVVAPSQDTFASLGEEVDRLVRLSRSLDALAVGDRAQDTPIVELDLRGAIEMAVELALPTFERRRIALSMHVPAAIQARANPDHVAQV